MRPLSCSEITERALIEQYLAGRLSDDDIEALESHYVACARCYHELRLAVAIRETLPEVAQFDTRQLGILELNSGEELAAAGAGVASLPPSRKRFGRRVTLPAAAALAAAAVVALMLVRPTHLTDGPIAQHRDASTTESEFTLQAPAGEVAAVREFHWAPVTEADRYRITLFDAAGTVIWQAETAETNAALPSETTLEPGEQYLWEVAARVDWNRWVRSDLVRFEIRTPPSDLIQ